jgi:hypothetical protein
MEMMRTHFGSAIKVTSSYRTDACNAQAGGVRQSYHLSGDALDFKFEKENTINIRRFKNLVLAKGAFLETLLTYKIKGIGVYPTHIHIDVGDALIDDNGGGRYTLGEANSKHTYNYWQLGTAIYMPEHTEDSKETAPLLVAYATDIEDL